MAPADVAEHVLRAVRHTVQVIEQRSASIGRPVRLDAGAELSRRDATPRSDATRLVATAAGWLAVSLARPDDAALVPAWLARWSDPGATAQDPWRVIDRAARLATASELLAAASGLGLPVAVVGERTPLGSDRLECPVVGAQGERARRPIDRIRVVDLSALWAGPLCGAILAEAGAAVTKVESTTRPDSLRAAAPALHRRLNARKAEITLDLDAPSGRDRLRALVDAADVVIEASRPRGLQQLGIDADAQLERAGEPPVRISITGFGRAAGDRVAFGDVAAAAGGLVAWQPDAGPAFVGDALADPLAGLAAASAALAALAGGIGGLVDVAMAGVAASIAPPAPVARRSMPSLDA